MSYHNFKKTLKISDVSEDDAGNYRCTATNNMGTVHHIIKVTVKGRLISLRILLIPPWLFYTTTILYSSL